MTRQRNYGEDTPFEAWCRSNTNLDSKIHSISNCDVDYNWHVYRLWESRQYQAFMEIEAKCGGDVMTSPQYDTLGIKQQFLQQGTKKVCTRKIEKDGSITRRRVWCHCFGVHYMRLQGLTPADSTWIVWNHKEISLPFLEKILRFEVHPKTFEPLTSRWYLAQRT